MKNTKPQKSPHFSVATLSLNVASQYWYVYFGSGISWAQSRPALKAYWNPSLWWEPITAFSPVTFHLTLLVYSPHIKTVT
jgi:hypothetical protein